VAPAREHSPDEANRVNALKIIVAMAVILSGLAPTSRQIQPDTKNEGANCSRVKNQKAPVNTGAFAVLARAKTGAKMRGTRMAVYSLVVFRVTAVDCPFAVNPGRP
jgi:hypothetical protein